MKIEYIKLTNFGSYTRVELRDFNSGLTLISGPTGSGKSTLQDGVAWVLFGKTAKDGSADDVRSWYDNSITTAEIGITLDTGHIIINRRRGKPNENDLFWNFLIDEREHRGKDLVDSQKRLNEIIGLDYDLYLTTSYFSEFSPAGQFFLTSAKEKRALLEQVASFSFPIKLAAKASEERKQAKKRLDELQFNLGKAEGRVEQLEQQSVELGENSTFWDQEKEEDLTRLQVQNTEFEKIKASKIATLSTQSARFEADKRQRLDALAKEIEKLALHLSTYQTETCPTCGRADNDPKRYELEKKLDAKKALFTRTDGDHNKYELELQLEQMSKNDYGSQIEDLLFQQNPHSAGIEKTEQDLKHAAIKLAKLRRECVDLEHSILSLTQLYDLSFDLRGLLLMDTVSMIESQTNAYLEKYFDALIRVTFTIDGSDSIEVVVQKEGNYCSYKQLSKGQRGVLKLCFVSAVMKIASNRAGTSFDNVFLDEALDGLDNDLKVKAFGLLSELAKDKASVMVIDHSEDLKHMFESVIRVELTSEGSVLDA